MEFCKQLRKHFDVAGALNFRDVMLAYGKLSKQQMAHESGGDNIGFEFSGVIVSLTSNLFVMLTEYMSMSNNKV